MSNIEFLIAALAVLATPGPTNTLLAASGAARGLSASLGLLVGELVGYLAAIVMLTTLIGPAVATRTAFEPTMRIVVGLYMLYLAWSLWARATVDEGDTPPVTAGRVFTTTLLNPKAAIFAFALLPPHEGAAFADLLPRLAVLSGLIAAVGFAWIAAGASLEHRLASPDAGYRAGAVALALLAAVIGGSALGFAHN